MDKLVLIAIFTDGSYKFCFSFEQLEAELTGDSRTISHLIQNDRKGWFEIESKYPYNIIDPND
jgi:hypothetical protein